MGIPYAVKEDRNYVILYKPGNMHCAPLKENEEGTLLDFCGRLFPEVLLPQGKKRLEGGLVHRLDYETRGLVLFARNQDSLNHFLIQQDDGLFLKQYDADVSKRDAVPAGFPAPPEHRQIPFELKSAFRPFGPGRKEVRPVLTDHLPKHKDVAFDNGAPYITKILAWESGTDSTARVKAELFRGFRHQIRCHLAWLGFPILNDTLYGGQISAGGELALKAVSLSFIDPGTEKPVTVSL